MVLWRDVNALRARLLYCVFQARQAKASIYICTHVWGIIGHVTVEAGYTVGTDGAPPQVPPKLCGGRLRG
jgi:hypothetical protein